MAQSYRSRHLSVVKQNEAALKTLFQQLARDIAAEVTKRADSNGNVPRSATFDIQQVTRQLVQRLFLGRTRQGQIAPFDLLPDGVLFPLSPYMRQLWESISAAVRIPVEQNAAVLANRLPADVQTVMQEATRNPFPVAKRQVREQVFRPNPLATYEAPHQWVDPNGYRLSDRVWKTATSVRTQIDAYLETAIKEGRGALQMSKELQTFLTPGEQLRSTNKPYGTTASYSAMRLARTEITHAAGKAAEVSAAMNPFVAAMKWNLSASHPRFDICDQYARGGSGGDGIYLLGETPPYPAHPHCLCYLTNVMVENPDAMIEQLRADLQAARQAFTDLVGPLAVEQFTRLLLGQGITVEYQTPSVTSRLFTPVVAPLPPIAPPPPPIVLPPPATVEPVLPPPAVEPPPPAIVTPVAKLPKDPNATLVWGKEPLYEGQKLNKVALKPAQEGYWLKVKDVPLNEPALMPGQRISTGLVIVEPDGRVWIVEPLNHFGGYQHTFPKGGLEQGLTAQQNALKEVFEESGLKAEITGYVGDFAGTTGSTRYYLAKRTGGAPWLSDNETATVKLTTFDNALGMLNVERDRNVLAAARAALEKQNQPTVPEPVPATVPTLMPTIVPASTGAAIPDLKDLTFVKNLGGSTGARLFKDAGGKQYVVKSGNSLAHIKSEALADSLYQTLGANVPKFRLQEVDGKTYKVAEFIEGKLLNELSGQALADAHKQLQKHFAADALLASWDVIGLGADNILVDKNGQVWRIDNGGSLLYRAQGAAKPMTSYMDELWSLRDKKINQQTYNVFGGMEYGQIAEQLSAIVNQKSAIMEMVTDSKLRTILSARLDHAADLRQIYDTLSTDKYIDTYIDRFSYHNTWIQSSGIMETAAKRLTASSDPVLTRNGKDVILVDENGKIFDDLRGANGIYAKFLTELNNRTDGRGAEFMARWAFQQSGDSWNPLPRYAKEVMSKNRPSAYYTAPTDKFITAAVEKLKQIYDTETVTDLTASLNALSYQALRQMEVGIRPAPGIIRLIRTESDYVMKKYGLTEKGQVGKIERGPMESTSLLQYAVVEGANLTEQDVPIHRVFGFYGFGVNGTMYANDQENELLALLDGVDVRFIKKVKRR